MRGLTVHELGYKDVKGTASVTMNFPHFPSTPFPMAQCFHTGARLNHTDIAPAIISGALRHRIKTYIFLDFEIFMPGDRHVFNDQNITPRRELASSRSVRWSNKAR